MIYLFIACLIVALLLYPSQIKRQVLLTHAREQARQSVRQPIPRVRLRTNGLAHSPTVYQPAQDPAQPRS